VLFLDEMGEFGLPVVDALRQPLEEGRVRISRARGSATFPARFLLVAAMNPCPCGEGGRSGRCQCSPAARERYVRHLSGPLLDRFDIAVRVDRPSPDQLMAVRNGEPTSVVADRVARARRRAAGRGVDANAQLSVSALTELAPMTRAAASVVERSLRSGALTGRGLHRVHRLARTVADLEGAGAVIEEAHVREALRMRSPRDVLLGGAGW
jgi:magnesium chelatase family protein